MLQIILVLERRPWAIMVTVCSPCISGHRLGVAPESRLACQRLDSAPLVCFLLCGPLVLHVQGREYVLLEIGQFLTQSLTRFIFAKGFLRGSCSLFLGVRLCDLLEHLGFVSRNTVVVLILPIVFLSTLFLWAELFLEWWLFLFTLFLSLLPSFKIGFHVDQFLSHWNPGLRFQMWICYFVVCWWNAFARMICALFLNFISLGSSKFMDGHLVSLTAFLQFVIWLLAKLKLYSLKTLRILILSFAQECLPRFLVLLQKLFLWIVEAKLILQPFL